MNDTKLKLTDRDLEILRLLGQGCTSSQIAEMLSLSPETIKWYRKRLLTKL
ncbi:MAG: helix-turn-helix transcriptional regulator, partial [Bacteroidales bacterium]|nr:helix-turn-helix transcriptional regulator [Bacteroidales bacterium]